MLLIAFCLILSIGACGNNNAGTVDSAANEPKPETAPPEEKPEQPGEKMREFDKNASIAETVMVDEGGVRITATGLNYTGYSAELELTIENNSGKNLSFVSGSLGYSCNSVNGCMVDDGYLNCDVADGKKAKDSVSFRYIGLMLYGIDEISDMEIGFDISDENYNHTYTGPRQVKTSAFDDHDYKKDCYQDAITSRAAMNTYNYKLIDFSQDALYDVGGVKLLSSAVIVNQDGGTALLLELENTTDKMVFISTSDIEINGLVVFSSTWTNDAINPGKRGIVEIEISSVLDSEYWNIYGIREIGTVALSLRQRDLDGNDVAEKTSVTIVLPDKKAEYDATGTEVYNNGGLRIVAKAVLEDSSGYSSDIHVLLLAENKSGRTLTVDDVYDSLSVNGFMTNYSCYSEELADGKCAVLEIELWGSSLEDNDITSASDIKEIEVRLDIKEGNYRVDKPVISIINE